MYIDVNVFLSIVLYVVLIITLIYVIYTLIKISSLISTLTAFFEYNRKSLDDSILNINSVIEKVDNFLPDKDEPLSLIGGSSLDFLISLVSQFYTLFFNKDKK